MTAPLAARSREGRSKRRGLTSPHIRNPSASEESLGNASLRDERCQGEDRGTAWFAPVHDPQDGPRRRDICGCRLYQWVRVEHVLMVARIARTRRKTAGTTGTGLHHAARLSGRHRRGSMKDSWTQSAHRQTHSHLARGRGHLSLSLPSAPAPGVKGETIVTCVGGSRTSSPIPIDCSSDPISHVLEGQVCSWLSPIARHRNHATTARALVIRWRRAELLDTHHKQHGLIHR